MFLVVLEESELEVGIELLALGEDGIFLCEHLEPILEGLGPIPLGLTLRAQLVGVLKRVPVKVVPGSLALLLVDCELELGPGIRDIVHNELVDEGPAVLGMLEDTEDLDDWAVLVEERLVLGLVVVIEAFVVHYCSPASWTLLGQNGLHVSDKREDAGPALEDLDRNPLEDLRKPLYLAKALHELSHCL